MRKIIPYVLSGFIAVSFSQLVLAEDKDNTSKEQRDDPALDRPADKRVDRRDESAAAGGSVQGREDRRDERANEDRGPRGTAPGEGGRGDRGASSGGGNPVDSGAGSGGKSSSGN
jgi:hypothetical protein